MSSKPDDTRQELFCGYCGERLPDLGECRRGACPACRRKYGKPKVAHRPPPLPESREDWLFHRSMYPTRDLQLKDPVLAALFSAVIPGAGQVYNLQLLKGLLIFCTCWLVIPYFLGIFDAYMTAEKANRWQTVEVGGRPRARVQEARSF